MIKNFICLIGIKLQTFQKMIEILKIAEEKRRIRGGTKNKLTIEQRLFMTLSNWKYNKKWTIPIQNWNTAIAHFMIKFEDRINMN